MKKLFLTGVTAALFSFAAIGQQQDSVQNQSNQYRQSDQRQQNPAAVDTSSNYSNQDQQQSDRNVQQQPGNEFNQGTNDLRDSVNQNDMERPSNQQNPGQSQDMQETAPGNNDNLNGQPDNQLNSQPDNQQTDRSLNEMNDQFRSSGENNQSNNQAPDLEVVRDKEGPDNQVVYKYEGDFYYVDRDKKELIKAKESDLQDAKHDVIIDQGNSENSGNDSQNSNRDSQNGSNDSQNSSSDSQNSDNNNR